MTYKRKKKFVLLDVLVEIPRDGQMHQWSAEPYFCLWEENTRTAGWYFLVIHFFTEYG